MKKNMMALTVAGILAQGAFCSLSMRDGVETLRQDTQLHKIIIQFDGWKLYRLDEV